MQMVAIASFIMHVKLRPATRVALTPTIDKAHLIFRLAVIYQA